MKTEFVSCGICNLQFQKQNCKQKYHTECARGKHAFNIFIAEYNRMKWQEQSYYTKQFALMIAKHELEFWTK